KHSKTMYDAPKTSAQPLEPDAPENLTLYDWMTVFEYIDKQKKPINQQEIANHFKSRPEGALSFTQPTLSCNLRRRKELECRANENPNALSSKRPRNVTRADVDQALALWVKHMEEKQELVSSAMLIAKWQRFEDQFDVPEQERLVGRGWIRSFCQAYKLREVNKHGKAGLVDPEHVVQEQLHLLELLAHFPVADHWNADET
ncbi:hypothetical protein CPB86DRAFT_683040, partial [Serendipita vermifera]